MLFLQLFFSSYTLKLCFCWCFFPPENYLLLRTAELKSTFFLCCFDRKSIRDLWRTFFLWIINGGKKVRKLSQNCPHSTVSCGAYRNGTGSVCLRLVSHNGVKSFQNGSRIRATAIDFQQARRTQHCGKAAASAATAAYTFYPVKSRAQLWNWNTLVERCVEGSIETL